MPGSHGKRHGPYSDFGKVRAAALGDGTAIERARIGTAKIITAIEDSSGHEFKRRLSDQPYGELLGHLQWMLEQNSVPMEIRYYDAVPSGPMIFLRDILLVGHYSVGRSSLRLPWTMIVDDPGARRDRFHFFRQEFESLWKDYSDTSPGMVRRDADMERESSSFISYARGNVADLAAADEIELFLRRLDRRVLRDETGLQIGHALDRELQSMIDSCGTFVALYSDAYFDSSYCMGELEAAMAGPIVGTKPRLAGLLTSESAELVHRVPLPAKPILRIKAHSRDARAQAVARLVEERAVRIR